VNILETFYNFKFLSWNCTRRRLPPAGAGVTRQTLFVASQLGRAVGHLHFVSVAGAVA